MKLQDNESRVSVAPAGLNLKPLAERTIPKDLYIAPGRLEALAIPSAKKYEVVFGTKLAVTRAPNAEKPGGAPMLVPRGESVDLTNAELEQVAIKLSKQRRMSQRILEISDALDPRNSSAPEALVGNHPISITVVTVGIDMMSTDFQVGSSNPRQDWSLRT
jgi:hypothetical protein